MQMKAHRTTEMKGLLGKSRHFATTVMVALNAEEQALFQKYDVSRNKILSHVQPDNDYATDILQTVTLADVMRGRRFEGKPGMLFYVEDLISSAFREALTECRGMEMFTDREVVFEIDISGAKIVARA